MDEILVVDDEVIITRTLKKILEKEGYVVTIANSGPEAVEAVSQKRFRLIITDIRMPGMDGVEAITKIKEILIKKGELNPIIFITGYADNDTEMRANEVGYTSYIYKPFDLKMFITKIKESLKDSC